MPRCTTTVGQGVYATGTSSSIWYSWNSSALSASSGTISVITDSQVWGAWNSGLGTAAIVTNGYAQLGNQPNGFAQPAQRQHWTPEERAARAAQQELADRQYRIEQARVVKAKERAEKLLHEMLSPQQSEELKANGHFHLETIAASGERRRYRINRGRAGNVLQVDEHGNKIKRLCVHPVEGVPDADTMLAQKLFLEGSEEELLRVANHS